VGLFDWFRKKPQAAPVPPKGPTTPAIPVTPTSGRFDRAHKIVLKYEGGNDDDPQDPGGRTSRGVIQTRYDQYRKRIGATPKDVWTATDAEIYDIYRIYYWDAMKMDLFPAGVDLCVYDAAVNSGPFQATKWLQRALKVDDDGVLGPVTMDAVQRITDPKAIILSVCEQRLTMLTRLKHWPRFGKGWSRRVNDVEKQALSWVK
jgi:lysozyme family protein